MGAGKAKKNKWEDFQKLGRENGFLVAETSLDLDKAIEPQCLAHFGGAPDVVIAKFTDQLQRALSPEGSSIFSAEKRQQAQQQLAHWADFQRAHPEVLVLDTPQAQTTVLDRGELCKVLSKVAAQCHADGLPVASAGFLVASADDASGTPGAQVRAAGLRYPLVVKPLESCGSPETHLMGLVFREEGLAAFSAPFLAQEYYNHRSVVYKVFVVGRRFSIVPRSSLRDFRADEEQQPTFLFDSQGINQNLDASQVALHTPPEDALISGLLSTIGQQLGLTIYGLDLIRNSETGMWSIIDVNFFPGFSGCVSQHHYWLLETVLERKKKD